MMAVETFVYLYILGFALSTVLSIFLLVAAARMISKSGRDETRVGKEDDARRKELLRSWSDPE